MPIPIAAIGAVASLVGSVGQTGLGLAQLFKGAGMKPRRPTYTIPSAITQATDRAVTQAGQVSREFQLGSQQADIAQSEAVQAAVDAGVGGSSVIQAASAAQRERNKTGLSLLQREQQARIFKERAAQQALAQQGQAQDRAFQLNKLQPYQDAAATKSRLMGSGLQNIFGGADSLGKSAAGAVNSGLFNSTQTGQ